MLEPIILEPTAYTPRVELDKERGIFRFEGKSLPEDVLKFFGPIQSWFTQYYANPNPETEFDFNLDYFNSSTSRMIVKILIAAEAVHGTTSKVHVLWHYRANDEVMQDRGLEIKSVCNVPFDVVEQN